MSGAFDSSEVDRMARALELAWQKLGTSGALANDDEALAKVALTKGIVEAADKGERDEPALAAYALTQYPRWRASILNGGATSQAI
jgi:hypothetical protein